MNWNILVSGIFVLFSLPSWAKIQHLSAFFRPEEKYFASWGIEQLSNGDIFTIERSQSTDGKESSWLVRKRDAAENELSVLDSFSLAPSKPARPVRSYKDAQDNFYVVGWATDSNDVVNSVLRRYAKGEWQTLDVYSNENQGATGYRIASKEQLLVYAGAVTSNGKKYGMTRLSLDGGQTWTTSHQSTIESAGYCVAIDSDYGIYSIYNSIESGQGETTYIYKSADLGQTWKLVSQYASGDFSCLVASSGVVYVAGGKFIPSSGDAPEKINWSVTQSSDKGETWTELISTNDAGNEWAYVHGIGEDSKGRIYFGVPMGYTNDVQNTFIPRYDPKSGTWTEFLRYSGTAPYDQAALKGFSLHDDYVYVSGYTFLKSERTKVGSFALRASIED